MTDPGSPSNAGGRFGPSAEEEPEPVVVRDKRRVNPFGAASDAAPAGGPPVPPPPVAPPAESPELVEAKNQLAERTADLQRLKAEYDNYRRRVDRDRQAGADLATAKVLQGMLGVLDDIDRAEQHGDLDGAFKAVAETLRAAVAGAGLEQFGVKGEPFDPQVHEALVHSYQDGLDGPTCIEIYRAGYRFAGRVLRPAQVVVAEPPAGAGEQSGGAEQTSDEASADGTA